MRAHQAGNIVEAQRLYEQLLKKTPNDFNAKQLLGTLIASKGNFSSASRLLRESLSINPNQPHVQNNLANCLVKLGHYEEAMTSFQNAINLKEDYLDAKKGLIKVLIDTHRFDEAEKVIDKALAMFPEQPQLLTKKADAYRLSGRFNSAIEVYEEILRTYPSLKNVRHNYAVALRLNEQPRQAANELLMLINDGMENYQVYHNLGNALADSGSLEKAIPAFEKAISLNPYYVDTHKNLNDALWETGNESNFLNSYKSVMQASDCPPSIIFSYCEFLLRLSQFSLVIDTLNQYASKFREYAQHFSLKARANRGLGKLEEAIENLQIALTLGGISKEQRIEFSETYILAGELQAAEKQLDCVLEKDSDNQLALAYIGTCWRLSNNTKYRELNNYENYIREYLIQIPEGFHSLEEFCNELSKYLTQLHNTKIQPLDQTLHHGTQTRGNLFSIQHDLINALKKQIDYCVQDYNNRLKDMMPDRLGIKSVESYKYSGSWSVNLQGNGYHNSHVHPMGWLSSVFYVDLPDVVNDHEEKQGWLKFGESFVGHKKLTSAEKEIQPVVGKLVLFPSYIWHGTNSFSSSHRRLTVAFDVVEDSRRNL